MLMDLAALVCILIAGSATAAMWLLGKKSGNTGSEGSDGAKKGNGENRR